MASALIARSLVVVFGLLYPSYMSYKAVKTRNVQAYVKWMMYWIVFALFYNVETITDLVLSWFPLYYELKVIFVFWLLSPQTQGSEIIYKLYVHPHLTKHEQELDQVWDKVKDQGYTALAQVGAQGLNLALQGAIKGQTALVERINQRERRDSTDSLRITEITNNEHMDSRYQDAEMEEPVAHASIVISHKSPHSPSQYIDSYHEPEPIPQPPFMRRNKPSRQAHLDRTDGGLRRQSSESSTMTRSNNNIYTTKDRCIRSYEHSIQGTPPTPPYCNPADFRSNRQSKTATYHPSSVSRTTQFISQSSIDSNYDTSRSSRSSGALPKALKYSRLPPADDSSECVSLRSKNSREKQEWRKPQKVKDHPLAHKAAKGPADEQMEEQADHINKYARSEATLRYRTKKISDIKHNKIQSPFISML